MKVFVYTKIKEHPNPENGGATKGDICYIYAIDIPQPGDSYVDFLPIVMDLKIPCGENFKNICLGKHDTIPCMKCQYHDPDDCDVRKYTMGEWTEGNFDNPPELKYKRKYFIDHSKFISAETEAMIVKAGKSKQEITALFAQANKNEKTISDIKGKE